jgi:serine/threonine protein kinase/tetratricopeptide (TPR) repeat protein
MVRQAKGARVMIGRTLSHYRITAELGAGGMGVVYRAHDTVLDRDVALKVLPPEFATDPERRSRFEREARAAARLSHPGIMQIHDFGVEGDTAFAVGELLAGRNLREVLSERRLTWREAVGIGLQIAEALAAAHAAGVVHRDLKPENVMMNERGRIKVLDFGLARILEPVQGGDRAEATTPMETVGLTREGAVLGTASYMAPEQVRGGPCDARTDVFALGCVLHELLTGRRAFRGTTLAATAGAVLRDEPPPASAFVADLPPSVERVVARCLKKRPADRFSSAHDVALALEAVSDSRPVVSPDGPLRRRPRWLPAAAIAALLVAASAVVMLMLQTPQSEQRAGEPESQTRFNGAGVAVADSLDPQLVAVMPLENRTGDPKLDVIGLMAADWISQGVARTDELRVVPVIGLLGPETGTGGTTSARDLAERTGAGIVVSGAYYLVADSLRFQATATDVVRGEMLYSAEAAAESARPQEAIGALRSALVGAIAVTANPYDPGWGGMSDPPSIDAYREYLAGLESFGADYEQAIVHFRRAMELDPDFIIYPTVRIATALMNQGRYAEAAAEFERLGNKRQNMTAAERHVVDGFMAQLDGRCEQGLVHMKAALREEPRSFVLQYIVGLFDLYTNRPGEAVEMMTRVSESAPPENQALPTCAWTASVACSALHMLGRHEDELAWLAGAFDACGNRPLLYRLRIQALAALGRTEDLERALEDLFALPGRAGSAGVALAVAARELRAHGYPEAGADMARRAVRWEREEGDDRVDLAEALLLAGENAEARSILRELPETDAGKDVDVDLLGLRGVAAARTGEPEAARQLLRRIDAVEQPYLLGRDAYWRAAVFAQLDEPDRAIESLRRAFAEGRTYGILWHRDPYLEPLWNLPEFGRLLEPKG